MQKKWMSILLVLFLTSISLVSCSGAPIIADTDHQHEYHLLQTVGGTCAAWGYQQYSCVCGESFKSDIPVPHSYVTLADDTDSHFMEICKVCGAYSITHEQEYIYHIDFENAETPKTAAKQGNSECYRITGSAIELVKDEGDMSLKVVNTNYYVLDKSETVKNGEDFVASMDIRYDRHGEAAIFSILCFYKDFSYNSGLIFVEEDGRLSSVNDGDLAYDEEVYLSEEGYDNIAVKGNLATGLYDIYVNDKLVRKNVRYVKAEDSLKLVCLRYFDAQNSGTYIGYADNLKLYAAAFPESVVDENLINFGN